MLSENQKKYIYNLLNLHFPLNTPVPLASISLTLNKEISYKALGYSKRKALLEDLPYIEMKKQEGSPNVSVIIHPRNEGNQAGKKTEKDTLLLKKAKKLLKSNFASDASYPLAKVSKFLTDQGVDYRKRGYPKRKNLLLDRNDILSLDDSDKKNRNVVFLSGDKKPSKKKETKPDKKSEPRKTAPKKETSKKNIASVPSPESNSFYIPESLILSIKEFSDLGLDDDSLAKKIEDDYRDDYRNNRIRYDEEKDAYIFPLSFKTKNGEDVIGSVKKSAPNRDYDYYLNFIGTDKVKAKNTLQSRIYFPDYENSIAQLASLAKKESWCYRHSKDSYIILKIYLQYTFYRLNSQKKFLYDESSGFGCFNTGLKNPEYEDIYGVVRKSKDPSIKEDYIFQGFCNAASQGLGKIVVEHFSPLPSPATFVSSPDQLVYDSTKELLTDYHHIIQDNIERFPFEWLYQFCAASPNEKGILDKIRREKNSYRKSVLYEQLEKSIEQNPMLYRLLKTALENTISKAVRIVKDDYRLALPSFFPTRDVRSIRLPLEFGTDKEIKAVLLVEKRPSGNYQGQTILTLKRAYVNSRLIAPLDHTYLNPDQIED